MSNASNTNNTAETIVSYQGGSTRIDFNGAAGQPDFEMDPLEGSKGSGRMSVIDGQVITESFTTQRTNVGQEFNERRAQATNILDTARAPHGGRAGTLNSQTVVMVGGMETSLGAAEQLGLVRRDSQGNYVETGMAPHADAPQPLGAQQQQQQQMEASGEDFMPLPPAVIEEINSLIAEIPQTMYDQTINHVLVNGVDSVNHKELARVMNVDEATARAQVAYVSNLYSMGAAMAIKGIASESAEDAIQWAAENKPRDFQNAMRRFIHGGETKALKELATSYMRSTEPEDSTLRHAGFETKTLPSGERHVRIQGVWMPVKAAVKAGWI